MIWTDTLCQQHPQYARNICRWTLNNNLSTIVNMVWMDNIQLQPSSLAQWNITLLRLTFFMSTTSDGRNRKER
jgi:hypothetical protein